MNSLAEMQKPSVYAHDRLVKTPFGLLGTDENSLTFALGYTMRHCPRLLQMLLTAVGLKGFHIGTLNNAKIHLQEATKEGITDIEVRIPNRLHLIIEAKVGLNVPTIGQCSKYIEKIETTLKASPSTKAKLVILLDTDPKPTLDVYHREGSGCKRFLTGIHWASLLDMQPNLLAEYPADSTEGSWLRAFYDFLEQEFEMKSYTDEVWIVPTNKNPLWKGGWSFYDTHVKGKIYYRTKKDRYTNHKPLYIALRTRGKVEFIQRVLKVEHEVRPIDCLPQFSNLNREWPKKPHTIWYLSEPTHLPHAIPTGDPSMRSRPVFCDLDILLSSSTVREVEKRMQSERKTSG